MVEGRPGLVLKRCPCEYWDYYQNEYCSKKIYTIDQFRVHCSPSSRVCEHKHCKPFFSWERAKRIAWIRPSLVSPESSQFFGWDKRNGGESLDRRVAFYEGFVVVLFLKLGKRGTLKADFHTCYPADPKARYKIDTSVRWDRDRAVSYLEGRRKESRGRKR